MWQEYSAHCAQPRVERRAVVLVSSAQYGIHFSRSRAHVWASGLPFPTRPWAQPLRAPAPCRHRTPAVRLLALARPVREGTIMHNAMIQRHGYGTVLDRAGTRAHPAGTGTGVRCAGGCRCRYTWGAGRVRSLYTCTTPACLGTICPG
eukprot:scaffold17888_cov149-Isochrysis_galbana.AAC.5